MVGAIKYVDDFENVSEVRRVEVPSNAVTSPRLQNQLLAEEIANGHAYQKHVVEQGEFPWIQTREQFQDHVENILNGSNNHRYYSDGRVVYLDEASETVVIKNPRNGESTAFQPSDWDEYINERLPKRNTPYF